LKEDQVLSFCRREQFQDFPFAFAAQEKLDVRGYVAWEERLGDGFADYLFICIRNVRRAAWSSSSSFESYQRCRVLGKKIGCGGDEGADLGYARWFG
jgi:hypothetical protein